MSLRAQPSHLSVMHYCFDEKKNWIRGRTCLSLTPLLNAAAQPLQAPYQKKKLDEINARLARKTGVSAEEAELTRDHKREVVSIQSELKGGKQNCCMFLST